MKIIDIKDPSLFQALVRKIYIAEYGKNYQVVDDSGGDNGLDGYDRENKDLHAIFCPIKPETSDYKRKYKSDLEKANELKTRFGYEIKRFIFITPTPLREPLQRDLRNIALEKGFDDGLNISAEYLETLMRKHNYLIDEFPMLSYPQVSDELKKITTEINKITQKLHSEDVERENIDNKDIVKSKDPINLFQGSDKKKIKLLKKSLYDDEEIGFESVTEYYSTTTDIPSKLEAMSVLAIYYFKRNDVNNAEAILREAANISSQYKLSAEEAYFHAHTANILSFEASRLDLIGVHKSKMKQSLGVAFESKEEQQRSIEKVKELEEQSTIEMRKALIISSKAQNLEAFYEVMLQFAWTNAYHAYPFVTINHQEEINRSLRGIRAAFERLISISPILGQFQLSQTFLAYSYILGYLNKNSEAIQKAKISLNIAKKENIEILVNDANKQLSDLKKSDE